MFPLLRKDLANYRGDWGAQGFWVMVVYRFGRWRYTLQPGLWRKVMSGCYKFVYKVVQVLTGIELPCEVVVGDNFVIDHFGGIVVSGYARFGDNCRLRHGVTIGLARIDDPCAPTFGNNVDIGTGAVILGRITIGDDVMIGANAVVLRDVPPRSIAVGVPAVVKPRCPG